jgi:hypothetical protein
MMKKLLLATAVVGALSSPAIADPAQFQHGLADGIAWRQWTGELYKVSEQAHEGAAYWAGQRSLANPGSCVGNSVEFQTGCEEAKKRLAMPDVLRKTQPDYRAGWNQAFAPDTVVPSAAAPDSVIPPVATITPGPQHSAPMRSQPLMTPEGFWFRNVSTLGGDNFKPTTIKDFHIEGDTLVGSGVVLHGGYNINGVEQAFLGDIMLSTEDADRDARALFYECKSQQCSDITIFGFAITCKVSRVNTVTGAKYDLPNGTMHKS